ncbi:MAG TPA: hypothetical protein VNJ09_06375 [Chthonomonadales bacterium]|nr:hypothetical protein [Chthonomonadales bacterium]
MGYRLRICRRAFPTEHSPQSVLPNGPQPDCLKLPSPYDGEGPGEGFVPTL